MIKKIFIILSVIASLILILAVSYYFVMRSLFRQMTPAETGQVTENIFAIRDGYVNVFLVKADSGYIMIDAGTDAEPVATGLKQLGIETSAIKNIFLTHTDSDHAGALSLFPHANVYLSRQEEQMINGETGRFLWFGNRLQRNDYKLLYEGQELVIRDITIKGILTPGHTPGTMCYLVNGKYLFTGDVIRFVNGEAMEFHHFINMDNPTGIKSIEKLSLLEGVEYVFTAHHGVSDNFEKAFENYRGCR